MGQRAKKVKLTKMCRFQFLDFNNEVTIRTFNKDEFILYSNLFVKNVKTNDFKRLEDIYYDIRTVRSISGKVVAKRKNHYSELFMLPVSS
ncbi:hypothetical protein BTS2_3366 [Bacillus sp. TS-2]|nr:hypothetical protein BTS2_3366 [Bacillus sp. TS-2]